MPHSPQANYPDMPALLRSLDAGQRRFLQAWLDAHEKQVQRALTESGKALSALSALLADAIASRETP